MRGNSGWASCHFRNFLRMSTGSTARPLGRRRSIPLLRYRSGSRASSRFKRSSHCFSSSRRAAVMKMVRQDGERTPLVPPQACAGWTETVNCHAHLRILLPQNRCLPEPLAAPFPHQPEPRCNTLDFASKVVCQRGAASRLSARSGASKCAAF